MVQAFLSDQGRKGWYKRGIIFTDKQENLMSVFLNIIINKDMTFFKDLQNLYGAFKSIFYYNEEIKNGTHYRIN